jgi:putative transposase
LDEAQQRLYEFGAKWDGAYPTISQMWQRNRERLTPFFAYPADIRKVIYTTNAVESLNMSLRKVIKTRGSFPTQEAALKLLCLALEHIAKKWTMPVQNWKGPCSASRFCWAIAFRKWSRHSGRHGTNQSEEEQI